MDRGIRLEDGAVTSVRIVAVNIDSRDSCCSLTSNAVCLDSFRPVSLTRDDAECRANLDSRRIYQSTTSTSVDTSHRSCQTACQARPETFSSPAKKTRTTGTVEFAGESRHIAEVDCGPANRTDHGEYPWDSPRQRSGRRHSHGQTCWKWHDTPAGTITAVPRPLTLCSGGC